MTLVDKRYTNGKPPYRIIQLPKIPPECGTIRGAYGQVVGQTGVACPGDMSPPQPATPPTTTTPPAGTPNTAPDTGSLLDQQVFGIPVKWLAIGVAVFFFMKK